MQAERQEWGWAGASVGRLFPAEKGTLTHVEGKK